MLGALSRSIAVLTLLLFPSPAGSASPQKLSWDELQTLIGRRVSIPLYDGCAVSGKVVEVKPDALVVHVEKTSHPTACPTGILRVQRSKLFVLDLHNPEKKYYGVGSAWGLVNDVFGWNQDPRTTSIQIVH